MPINSVFVCDFNDIINELPENIEDWKNSLNDQPYKPQNDRAEGLRIIVGNSLLK